MSVTCGEIAAFLDRLAPPELAEGYDNVGLLVGNPAKEVNRILIALDVTKEVVAEAIQLKAEMIVSHHPLIFKALKRVREDEVKGRILHELIRHGISVYSAHTNLDVVEHGVNAILASKLGLKSLKPLKEHQTEALYKLVVFVPEDHAETVRLAMCSAGAGWIGNYSDCTFTVSGTGTFKPLQGTNPFIGEQGKLEQVTEKRIETIVPAGCLKQVLKKMLESHPYEEPAYDVIKTEEKGKVFALGLTGALDQPETLEEFIITVKKALDVPAVRLIGRPRQDISRVAVFCGSFDDDLGALKRSGADILVTGDLKYHTASDAEAEGLCIVDAGHFHTEKLILPVLAEILRSHFEALQITCNSVETDPFSFY